MPKKQAIILTGNLPIMRFVFKAFTYFRIQFKFQVSILHQACCARTTARQHWLDIIKVCINLGADVNDVDCIGQTPLFYAVSHCQAKDIVPLLIQAGERTFAKRIT